MKRLQIKSKGRQTLHFGVGHAFHLRALRRISVARKAAQPGYEIPQRLIRLRDLRLALPDPNQNGVLRAPLPDHFLDNPQTLALKRILTPERPQLQRHTIPRRIRRHAPVQGIPFQQTIQPKTLRLQVPDNVTQLRAHLP